jgi:putative hydrolase of the HAD superfamily
MKPHLAIFEFALRTAGAEATSSIMIGDTLDADIEGGNKAGMDTVYFNPAEPASGNIVPTYVIQNLGELKKIL